ncbi:unnamed protein product [Larinioides sclopetarius]|uniref:CRAL-TRIO domain-containing protein n=1 Tax=Larinioides sclopetarius TaxID=280406 RepID=A0AAV1ZUB4_9ARAC
MQLYRDPMVQIHGFKVIYDFKDTDVRHLRYATFQNLWLLYHVPANCLPAREKGVHLINQTVLPKALWTIIKPLLSEKLKSRVHFHSNPEELLYYFPRSMLPVEYGGELSDVDCTELIRNLNKEQQKNTVKEQPNFY